MNLKTERGYEDPCVTQLAVFLHNRVGQLGEVLRGLESAGVTVHALSVTDNTDFAVVRLIVDRVEEAKRALASQRFVVAESVVLVVGMQDARSELLQVTRALVQAEVNIHYVYPMFSRPGGLGALVVHVDSIPMAAEVLSRCGLTLIDEQDLVGQR